MGIGILFSDMLQEEFARKELKPLKFSGAPELVGHSYIIFNKKKPLSPAANDFLAVLRSLKSSKEHSAKLSA
jgi:hypothetical protein